MSLFKKYGFAWATLGFLAISLVGHWLFGWFAFVDEQQEHGVPVEVGNYVVEMLRDTFENWQSEFLQLLWQVVGLAYFLYIGSPSSKENDDRLEAKIDELLRMQGGGDKGQAVIDDIDKHYLLDGGHAVRFNHRK